MTTHTITVDTEGNGQEVNPNPIPNETAISHIKYWDFEANVKYYPAPGLKPGEYEGAYLQWQGLMWDKKSDEGNGGYEWEDIFESSAEWFNSHFNHEDSEIKKIRQIWILESSTIEQVGEEKTAEEKHPMGSLDFAVKVKGMIVSVYSDGTEEPAQRVGALYNKQLNIFKATTSALQSENERLRKALEESIESVVSILEKYKSNYSYDLKQLKGGMKVADRIISEVNALKPKY
jgi:hypothetical protein